jgi:aminopeptidase N
MPVPLVMGLIDRGGRELPLVLDDGRRLERGVLTLSKAAETFVFTGIAERPVASLNRGFSAPVKLTANLSGEDLRFLAARDGDPFNRWQAVQTIATRVLVDNTEAARSGKELRKDSGLIAAFRSALEDQTLEPAFQAQVLALPSEADIAREIGRDVDPDAIFKARQDLRAAIASDLDGILAATYAAMSDTGPYRPDAASAGRRALKNACLELLAATGSPAGISRAAGQYEAAGNMTDEMAALATLALHDVPERTSALEDFYRRYANDPLIVDKWLALQATIPEPATLERVRALTHHPAFLLTNPNRVRALIASFAQSNQTQFNRRDGGGYEFLADIVLELDPTNPQVAARLLAAFKSWRALESLRRSRAEAALRRVAAASTLSRDVGDIVQRALGDEGGAQAA